MAAEPYACLRRRRSPVSWLVNGMVAAVIFETKRLALGRWSCLIVAGLVLLAPLAEAEAQSLRFRPNALTFNGQAPAVFLERNAEQILNAQVFYEVDYGYEGGDHLFVQVEPFGAHPATLTPRVGSSPRCSVGTTPANVDVAVQNPAWVPNGASAGHSTASFVLPEPPDDIPPPQPRSFAFSFGTLCQDSDAEPTEQFRVTVWFQSSAGAPSRPAGSLVVQYLVRIIDDDGDGGPGAFTISPEEFTVVETDEDAPAPLTLAFDEEVHVDHCFPFQLVYARGTAGPGDAWVGSRGTAQGSFVLSAGSTAAVLQDLIIAGDDDVEGIEVLYIDVYSPRRASTCSVGGQVVAVLAVSIEDDDLPVMITSLQIDGAADGIHREGDSGERDSVHVIVTFGRRLTEPVTLSYGSVADADARGTEPNQDVETVPERSVTVEPGQIAVRVRVATIIGDDRVEAVEYFSVWAAVDGYSAESRMWLRVGIANDDVPGDRILDVVLEGGGVEGASIVEGDPDPGAGGGDCQREWKCVFLILGFTGERQSKDVVYQVHTVAGSARPGEDYRFSDGVRVRLEEGHLRTFDVRDPLQLQVRRDFFVEAEREDLFLVVHMLAGDESPLFSWYERIEIVDDDRPGGVDGSLWFGLADGLESCPEPRDAFVVAEPPDGGVRLVRVDLAMAQQGDQAERGGQQDARQGSCRVGVGKPVTEYRYELRSGAAEVGRDVLASAGAGSVVRFVSGRATLELGVVGDGQFERAEDLTLALVSGAGTVAVFTVVVEDAESTRETVSSRTASTVRIGRVLASEVSDVLADRFSCAASPACAQAGASAQGQLWPGGRSGPYVSPVALLRRLAWSAGSVAMPGMAPSLASDGGAQPLAPQAGTGPGRFGSVGIGTAGAPDRFGHGSGAVSYGLHGRGALDADRLAVVGRAIDGLRYQGDPGRWLGAVNIARGDHRPRAWTFWARSSYGAVDDASSTARRLRTSMLSMTGGLDRQVGRFRVGVLYTQAFAQSETALHRYAQEFVGDDPAEESSWRVVAPYVGWVPHRRFALWVSPGWVTGRGGAAALGEGLDATMRMVVSGASLSVYSSREVSVDVEADVFEVDADRTPSVSEVGFAMPDDAFSGRAQRARLAGRMGFPLGDPETAASRLTVRLGRRWDVGTDIDWVWGPGGRPASWEGAGQVSATDLLLDLRYGRVRSSLSLVLTLGVQLGSKEPLVDGQHLRFASRRQVGFGGGVAWGAAGSGAGWSASLRPSYGHVSAAMPGWWSGAVPRIGGFGGFDLAPMVDAEAGYGFEDGGRVSVSGRRAFGGGRPGAGGLGAVLRYGRGW